MPATFVRQSISAEASQLVALACIQEVAELDVLVALVVVDELGEVKAALRMDGVAAAHLETAVDRARRAVRGDAADLPDGGATSLAVDGEIVGGLGVGGVCPGDVERIMQAGVQALHELVDGP